MDERFESAADEYGGRRRRIWWMAAGVVGITLAALALRVRGLERQSLHYDELWNVELATGRGSMHFRLPAQTLFYDLPRPTSLEGAPPVWSIWTHMDHVTHPPLYSMLLRLWCDVAGTRDRATRGFTAVVSALAILLLFDAVRTLHGNAAALWAAGIMALSGAQIEMGQEVRPYAMLVLFGCGALAAMARIARHGINPRRLTALGGCALAMLLVQYFSFVAIGALALFALLALRGKTRIATLGALTAAVLVFAIAWGPFLWAQRGSFSETGDNWLRVTEPDHALQTLRRLALVPMRLLFQPLQRSTGVAYLAAVLLVLPVMLALSRKRQGEPGMLLWALWMWATVGLVTVLELTRLTRHLEEIRYTLLAGPALYAMLPILVARSTAAWLRHAVPAIVAIGCAISLPAAYPTYKDDFRGIANVIDAHHAPGEPVLFSVAGSGEAFGGGMFLGVSHYSRTYPWPMMIVTEKPGEQQLAPVREAPGAWVIAHGSMGAAEFLPGESVVEQTNFPPLAVVEHVVESKREQKPEP